MAARCKSCRYYRAKRQEAHGECRANAPVGVAVKGYDYRFVGVWPEVTQDGWCGRFAPKERKPQ